MKLIIAASEVLQALLNDHITSSRSRRLPSEQNSEEVKDVFTNDYAEFSAYVKAAFAGAEERIGNGELV